MVMTSHQDTGTSPLVPLSEEHTSPVSRAEGISNDTSPTQSEAQHTSPVYPQVHSSLVDTQECEPVSRGYTPSSTPVGPYRYSDHIHRDRHIFLKGASVGIGCGTGSPGLHTGTTSLYALSTDPQGAPYGALTRSLTWFGGSLKPELHRQGSLLCSAPSLQLGMASGDNNLPSVSRVQLALSSGDCSKQRQNHHRFPNVSQHHQPPAIRRRPFNEQLNTYVDTQKRIRSVQCLDDLYRATPSPAYPYLSTPSPKRQRATPPPVKGRAPPAVRASMPILTRQPTTLHPPPMAAPGRPVNKATALNSPGTQTAEAPAAAAAAAAAAANTANMPAAGCEPRDQALAEARNALLDAHRANSNHNYAQYFLAKEGREGTLGHLFDSYPKRVLVHPGRSFRQRHNITSRARLNMYR